MIHKEQHPAAGSKLRIKASVKHFQFPNFGGSEFHVEDWWDRLGGGSWMDAQGNPACLIYAMRSGMEGLPIDNEVLYGHVGSFGSLVHVSELEEG